MRLAFGGNRLAVQEITCNPAGREELVELLPRNGLEIAAGETLAPPVRFRNLEDFLEFGYRGGWLTPFVAAVGLDRAGWLKRKLINLLCFPIADHHEIEIILARKPAQAAEAWPDGESGEGEALPSRDPSAAVSSARLELALPLKTRYAVQSRRPQSRKFSRSGTS